MKLLLDTHLLLWAAGDLKMLPPLARELINDTSSQLYFSTVSIWEIAIKFNLGRKDFSIHPRIMRQGLLQNQYEELDVRAEHVMPLAELPRLHNDPFDRLLIAQAITEGLMLLTVDRKIADYPGPIRFV